jgi:hypothetical protein
MFSDGSFVAAGCETPKKEDALTPLTYFFIFFCPPRTRDGNYPIPVAGDAN